MKRILWMVLLTLALPMAAFANSNVDFTNSGGTLAGSSTGLTLTGSELIAVTGLNGMPLVTGDLGSVSFSTGSLSSGDLLQGQRSIAAEVSRSRATARMGFQTVRSLPVPSAEP